MGLGQTMLTSLFLVLLSLAVISGNRLMIDRETSFYEQEAYKQAGILANALLQEIVRKKFDSKVDTSRSVYVTHLTDSDSLDQPASLGAPFSAISHVNPSGADDVYPYKSIDNSSSATNFDDIDDYKGYHRYADAGGLTGFKLTVDVYYVKLSGGQYLRVPNFGNATYWKKVDVTVKNSKYLTLKDSVLTFSTIVAY